MSILLSDKVQCWIQGVSNNIKQGTSLSGLNCAVHYWWHSSVLDIYPVQYVYWTTTGSPTRSVYLWSLYLGIQTRGKPLKHTAIFLTISIFLLQYQCKTISACIMPIGVDMNDVSQWKNVARTSKIWTFLCNNFKIACLHSSYDICCYFSLQWKFEIASPAWKKYHRQQHYRNQILHHYLKSHLGSRRWRNHVTKNSSSACHTTPQDYRSSKGGWTP